MTTFNDRYEYYIDQGHAYIRDHWCKTEYVLPLQMLNQIVKHAKAQRLRASNKL